MRPAFFIVALVGLGACAGAPGPAGSPPPAALPVAPGCSPDRAVLERQLLIRAVQIAILDAQQTRYPFLGTRVSPKRCPAALGAIGKGVGQVLSQLRIGLRCLDLAQIEDSGVTIPRLREERRSLIGIAPRPAGPATAADPTSPLVTLDPCREGIRAAPQPVTPAFPRARTGLVPQASVRAVSQLPGTARVYSAPGAVRAVQRQASLCASGRRDGSDRSVGSDLLEPPRTGDQLVRVPFRPARPTR